MAFTSSVDIANLGLQFLGLPRISTTLGFTENSQRAQEMQAAYGKLKRAELRRTVYQWAIRRAVLRPLDTNTMIVTPSLYSSTATYFRGSIVTDSSGFLWVSKIPNNTGNTPSSSPTDWEPYFGPLTVMLYDSTLTYFAGELVYTTPGDGTYNVYISQVSGNGLDPSLPNVWSASATYFKNYVVTTYANWSSSTTYAAGATILYTDGNYYTSVINTNHNITPPNNSSSWALTPILQLSPTANAPTPAVNQPQGTQPQSTPVLEWVSGTTYSIGSFVMFAGTEYVSIANTNQGNPPNASGSTFWAALTGGTSWMSLIDLNINNNPTSTPSTWAVGTTYSTGNQVAASDGFNYTSKINSNLGNNPANNANPSDWTQNGLTAWTSSFTGVGAGNQQWIQIGGASSSTGVALSTIDLVYPLGTGPSTQSQTRNVFRLPAGYLREAPQDPKAGSTNWLGAPSGLWYNDWTKWGNYIISRAVDPIVYTFVADCEDVTQWDDMFCAGLAYRLALTTAPILTNSNVTKQMIAQEYKQFMSEARIIGGIDTGPTEPPEDDMVVCRL